MCIILCSPLAAISLDVNMVSAASSCGGQSISQFLDSQYSSILHRAAEPDGKDWWIGQLSSGSASCSDVIADFAASNEAQSDAKATANLSNVVSTQIGSGWSQTSSVTYGNVSWNGDTYAQQTYSSNGETITVQACANSYTTYIDTKTCSSAPNSCGMTTQGVITTTTVYKPSGEINTVSSTACSAGSPSDSLCYSSSSAVPSASPEPSSSPFPAPSQTSCTPSLSCDTTGTSIVNSCTGARTSCAPGRCLYGACVPFCGRPYYCSGNDVVDSCNAVFQECQFACVGGACVVPSASIDKWSVLPLLVRKGGTVTISWSVSGVTACAVSGTNGDGPWTTLSDAQTSSPIGAQTIYTLSCTGDDGNTVKRQATVNIVPTWKE